jgi:hypothetical protein
VTEAIAAFNGRFEDPFIQGLYHTQSSLLSDTELERFTHTRDFQQWLRSRNESIVCVTSAAISLERTPLAACIARYVQARCRCVVIYIDCYWILQTPKQDRLRTVAFELQKEEMKMDEGGEDSSERVLELLYSHLFRSCERRQKILEEYHDSLSMEEASRFRSHMLNNRVPQMQDLLYLIGLLYASFSSPVLISVDQIDALEVSARYKLISYVRSLPTYGTNSFKPLFCGTGSLLSDKYVSSLPIISDETETQGE